jgi:tRNA(Ile)-lysidine synthase
LSPSGDGVPDTPLAGPKTLLEAGLAARFLVACKEWPQTSRVWVAFSGGADSTALLDLCARMYRNTAVNVRAVHVDHGLHPESQAWGQACIEQGEALGVEVEVHRVQVPTDGDGGLEDAARKARFTVFRALMEPGDIICTAHHASDQAETFLMRALRGAGVRGLGAIAPLIEFESGWLARPLLDFERHELRDWLVARDVTWTEDPANADTRFDRVFLRREILPRLKERWPATNSLLARTARIQRATMTVIDDEFDRRFDDKPVQCDELWGMSEARRAHFVRAWLRAAGAAMPSESRLREIVRQALTAGVDKTPAVEWGRHCVRRYRGALYLTERHLPNVGSDTIAWKGNAIPSLPYGALGLTEVVGQGFARKWLDTDSCELRFRKGGEFTYVGDGSRKASLKNLLQGWGVQPWLRHLLPLVYVDGELAVIAGRFTAARFRARPQEAGLVVDWQVSPCASAGSGTYPLKPASLLTTPSSDVADNDEFV